jgi:hypothetical protein
MPPSKILSIVSHPVGIFLNNAIHSTNINHESNNLFCASVHTQIGK